MPTQCMLHGPSSSIPFVNVHHATVFAYRARVIGARTILLDSFCPPTTIVERSSRLLMLVLVVVLVLMVVLVHLLDSRGAATVSR